MKTINKSTWLGYLDLIKCKAQYDEHFQFSGFADFMNLGNISYPIFRHIVPFVYLLDYRNRTYLNMSDNFAGYKSESFLDGGIDHTLEIYDRTHLNLFNKEIFPDRLQILKTVEPEEHKNYVFSYTSKIKNRNGHYEYYLQRNCFLSDNFGNPLYSMGILINITNYRTNNPIIQTVDEISMDGSLNKTIFEKVYYLNEEDKLFSKREKEVLLWMADGLSSKMIAGKLFVSEHTIINHRRNMHEKTNTANATALVSFAIRNGII